MGDVGRDRRTQSTIQRATSPELAAGRRVGTYRGPRSCRGEDAGGSPPASHLASIRGKKKRGCSRGQISRDQNLLGQIICLS